MTVANSLSRLVTYREYHVAFLLLQHLVNPANHAGRRCTILYWKPLLGTAHKKTQHYDIACCMSTWFPPILQDHRWHFFLSLSPPKFITLLIRTHMAINKNKHRKKTRTSRLDHHGVTTHARKQSDGTREEKK